MFQILVVDDDKNTRLLLKAVLQAENYSVHTAENGEEALEVMQEIENACGLAFTDIVNNSHLGSFTEVETLLGSIEYTETLSRLSGLPVYFTSVREDLAPQVSKYLPNVFPLHLQEKYFDLPDQRL